MSKVDAEREKFFAELRKQLEQPPTAEELERRHQYWREVDQARVKVGRDFNIVKVVREMRGGY